MEYTDSSGEVFTQEELIKEIERLLNRNDCNQTSSISLEVMSVLDLQTLGMIREKLLNKVGCEIEENSKWLLGLVDR